MKQGISQRIKTEIFSKLGNLTNTMVGDKKIFLLQAIECWKTFRA